MDSTIVGLKSAVTLRQVQGFLLAGSLLSFSEAASQMHVSQSAFSQLIREMERVLDLRLFERTTRRVELTEAGRLLYQKMQLGFAQIGDACEEARALARGERGRLTFGVLPSLAIGVVARTMRKFVDKQSQVRVNVKEDYNGALLERVVSGELDFAMCAYAQIAEELEFDHLFDDDMVLLHTSNALCARKGRVDWRLLHGVEIIAFSGNTSSREQITESLMAHDVVPRSSFEVTNVFTAISMVRSGIGYTFVPRMSLADLDLSGMAWNEMQSPSPTRKIGIFKRKDRHFSPAALAFLGHLRPEVVAAAAVRPRMTHSRTVRRSAGRSKSE